MDGFISAIKNSRFSVIPGARTLFQALAACPGFKDVDLSNYKVAIGGGAAVIKATSEKWKALTGHHIKEGYGLSETSPVLCVNPMSVSEFTETCGLPVPSTDIKLLDEDGNEVPEGEAGEISARGPQVMQGYWNNPEANANAYPGRILQDRRYPAILTAGGFVKIVDRRRTW
jgi:long-chain acyl-CoA synthetase